MVRIVKGVVVEETGDYVDIGHGVGIRFMAWRDHERAGITERHPTPDGSDGGIHYGGVLFDLPGIAEAFPNGALWQVESFDPLTLSPSLLCPQCGHHGWIRAGRWEPA